MDDQYQFGMKNYLEQNNPYARQVLLATLLDVASRGLWKATAAEKAAISTELTKSAATHGLIGSADVNRNTGLTKILDERIEGLPGGRALMHGYTKALSAASSDELPPAPEHKSTITKASGVSPNTITRLVLHETSVQAGSQSTGPVSPTSYRRLLLLGVIIALLFLAGWLKAAKEIS